MPAVLGESAYDAWLAPDESDPAPLVELLLAQSPALVAVPVSTRVNKPANDDAGLIEPIDVPRGLFD
jgi:putative SOS response-associated peptidase YedK